MAIIITYDISSDHVEFKEEMFQLGYVDQISGNKCQTIYLPNTTLYHNTKSAVTARDEVKAIARKVGTDLERCVVTKWDNWAAICGEPF